jgi:hypothetical protein
MLARGIKLVGAMLMMGLPRWLVDGRETLPAVEFAGHPIELFEYAALKQEQATRIALRETALYANLGVTATMLTIHLESAHVFQTAVLLLAPLISGVMFWIYFNNDYYVSRIGAYISGYLAPRIAAHLKSNGGTAAGEAGSDPQSGRATPTRFIFAWESMHRARSIGRATRKLLGLVVVLASFESAPVAVLIYTLPVLKVASLDRLEWIAGAVVAVLIAIGSLRSSR